MTNVGQREIMTQRRVIDFFSDAWLVRLGDRLGETEGNVLLLIRSDLRISTRIMAENLDVSTTAIDKTLARLKARGFLRRIEPARGGYGKSWWIVMTSVRLHEILTQWRMCPKSSRKPSGKIIEFDGRDVGWSFRFRRLS